MGKQRKSGDRAIDPNGIGASEFAYWTAREAIAAFKANTLSPTEYAEGLAKRVATLSRVNAFIDFDPSRLEKAAANAQRGPLAALPIAVKDAIGTADLKSTAATPALSGHRPEKDAAVVAALKSAGAWVFGKLNMHELSYGITSNNAETGAVRNPHDPSRIPGGSSGGAGAAVAAGLIPVALGTDTGGSVRIPAALCGVVGFRPSAGRYSQAGIIPVSHTRDTAGPLCRSVDDASMVDAAIMGEDDRLAIVDPGDITLGVPENHFLEDLDPDVRSVFETRLEDLSKAGFKRKDVLVEEVVPPAEGCGFPIALFETRGDLAAYLEEHAANGPDFDELTSRVKSPDVAAVLGGLRDDAFTLELQAAYKKAMTEDRPRLQRALANCYAENGIDALIFPTTRLTARPIGQDETVEFAGAQAPTFPTYIHNTDPGSIVGLPGVSLPAGVDRERLPIGIELDAPEGADRRLLAIARLVERHFPPPPRPNIQLVCNQGDSP